MLNQNGPAVKESGSLFVLTESGETPPEEIRRNLVEAGAVFGDSITDARLYHSPGIMLYGRDDAWVLSSLRSIRTHPDLFLKPICVACDGENDEVKEAADLVLKVPLSESSLAEVLERVNVINRRLERMGGGLESLSPDQLRRVLILRFLHSRGGRQLTPVRNLASGYGYSYPVAQYVLATEPGEEVGLLEQMEAERVLGGELRDRVSLCPFCQSCHINFREVCPHCGSLRFREEVTLHHYRCAYVGKESEFRSGVALVCPKCRRELRHIGVDYDRPAENVWCEECERNFSETAVSCFCLACGRTFEPEQVVPMEIKSYRLTREGTASAEDAVLPVYRFTDVVREEVGFYRPEVFRELLRLEVLRTTRYGYESTLARLRVARFEEILEEEGRERARELRQELARILRETFRETDILAELGDEETLVIFTHTDASGVGVALDRLKEQMRSVLKKELEFQTASVSLRSAEADPDALISDLR